MVIKTYILYSSLGNDGRSVQPWTVYNNCSFQYECAANFQLIKRDIEDWLKSGSNRADVAATIAPPMSNEIDIYHALHYQDFWENWNFCCGSSRLSSMCQSHAISFTIYQNYQNTPPNPPFTVNYTRSYEMRLASVTMAHELGHQMGLAHDEFYHNCESLFDAAVCPCWETCPTAPDARCFMSAAYDSDASAWSLCSELYIRDYFLNPSYFPGYWDCQGPPLNSCPPATVYAPLGAVQRIEACDSGDTIAFSGTVASIELAAGVDILNYEHGLDALSAAQQFSLSVDSVANRLVLHLDSYNVPDEQSHHYNVTISAGSAGSNCAVDSITVYIELYHCGRFTAFCGI